MEGDNFHSVRMVKQKVHGTRQLFISDRKPMISMRWKVCSKPTVNPWRQETLLPARDEEAIHHQQRLDRVFVPPLPVSLPLGEH
ncbi:MAG: hypothetical protein R3E95_18085 [Thiolinea sp.]